MSISIALYINTQFYPFSLRLPLICLNFNFPLTRAQRLFQSSFIAKGTGSQATECSYLCSDLCLVLSLLPGSLFSLKMYKCM